MTAVKSQRAGEQAFGQASDYLPQTGIIGAEAVAEAQREMMSFVAQRLEKDADTFRDFGQCTTMADAVQVQVRWAQGDDARLRSGDDQAGCDLGSEALRWRGSHALATRSVHSRASVSH